MSAEPKHIPQPESPDSGKDGDTQVENVDVEAIGTPEETKPFRWDLDIWLNLIARWACFFTSTWLLIIGSSTISFVAAAFPQDAGISIWMASSVTIANCVIPAFLGDLSDHFGRKWPLSSVLNGIGLTCGYLAIPLTAEIVPKDQRARIQAVSGIASGIAFVSGPIIAGGLITHHVGGEGEGWRAPFYISTALCFVAFVIVAICYHPAARPNPENLSFRTRLMKIDWIGVFLVTAGLTLFLVGLKSGGVKDGLAAHALFADKNYTICLLLNFVGGIILFGGQAFLPQEIVQLFTSDAILTGVYNIPFNAMTIGGAIIAAAILAKTHEPKWIVVAAFVALLVALLGTALGIQTSLLIVVVSVCTPDHLIASAVSVTAATRALGGSIGTVIFSQIFSSKLRNFLPNYIAEAAIEAGLPECSAPGFLEAMLGGNQTALFSVPGVNESIVSAATAGEELAYTHGFRYVWYSLIPFAALGLLLSLWLQPTRHLLTTLVMYVLGSLRQIYNPLPSRSLAISQAEHHSPYLAFD